MPAQISTYVDQKLFSEWRDRFAELSLTKSELARYSIAISCGYSSNDALIIARMKPGSSDSIYSILGSKVA